jgi:hypothetical protein
MTDPGRSAGCFGQQRVAAALERKSLELEVLQNFEFELAVSVHTPALSTIFWNLCLDSFCLDLSQWPLHHTSRLKTSK